ncbi:hypothetical protein [Mesobacillus maritimus]|uniref:Uncharacterized protein n=1 Tax=Mesobacillus maritimus TaxID=1643336 RepID=A0ABS7K3T8_9BACI|nr:hypothetical protein [Mesobacillus maritimus]MBY0096770.1 hypothetical protein [Mesobacillus maritimus]
MFELYVQSYDFTAVYTLYIALFLTVALQVLWLINVETPLLESPLRHDIYLLSESASAYKYQAELAIDLHILILRKIKMKVAPEEDMSIFLQF